MHCCNPLTALICFSSFIKIHAIRWTVIIVSMNKWVSLVNRTKTRYYKKIDEGKKFLKSQFLAEILFEASDTCMEKQTACM